MFELEEVINSLVCLFLSFWTDQQIPTHLSKKGVILKSKEHRLIKVTAPFVDKISGLVIIKILDGSTHSNTLIKLTCNTAILDIVNNDTETIFLRKRR